MNRLFNNILSGSDAPTDPRTTSLFVNNCCEFLDRLIGDLSKQSQSLDAVIRAQYNVTHDYQRFGYGFDPEDDKSALSEYISSLSRVGAMGIAMCDLFEGLKKEIDGLHKRATEMRGRFNAYLKFSKSCSDKAAVKNAFDSLKLDFTSEILDECIRMYNGNLSFCQQGVQLLQPVVDSDALTWRDRCCSLQKHCLVVRSRTKPMSGDAALTRGSPARIFGTPLGDLPLIPGFGIPQILFDTTEALINVPGMLDQEGLFRVGPCATDLAEVKAAYDKGQNVVISSCDPHVITGILKMWLRELPDSLIPAKIAVKFAAAANDDPTVLKDLLPILPTVNRRCLHKLMEVGVYVTQHSYRNKMTADNIARIFGPNIIRREDELNPLTQVANLITLANNMLVNYDIIFGPFM